MVQRCRQDAEALLRTEVVAGVNCPLTNRNRPSPDGEGHLVLNPLITPLMPTWLGWLRPVPETARKPNP